MSNIFVSKSTDIESIISNVKLRAKSIPDDQEHFIKFVAQNGREFKSDEMVKQGTVLHDDAKTLAEYAGAVPKRCFQNCRQAMQMEDQIDADVQYCEGYIQYMENVQTILTRHAWILLDGYVAEITISPEILPDEKRSYCGVQCSLAEAAEIADMHG